MFNNTIKKFLSIINKDKNIVLSVDLDNTLVNREKGDNCVTKKNSSLIKKLIKQDNFYFIPNTGRDVIGFQSFVKETTNFPDAILGSGKLIKSNHRYFFNSKSVIEKSMVNLLTEKIKQGILPFMDITHKDGRLVVYNKKKCINKKNLFFSQNPRSWFGKQLPPTLLIDNWDRKPKSIYRLEFPVFAYQKELFEELINKKENGINYLANILGVKLKEIKNYTLKRKVFFNKKYKDKLIFARLEKNNNIANKGQGIKIWLKKRKLNNYEIIHIGDSDYGVVNDALVKVELPRLKLVMVGDKCKRDNPLVDLYLTKETSKALEEFMRELYQLLRNK